MKLIFLGTGTSTGVPQIGCTCPVCTSRDARDRRLRSSALLECGDTRILIDCGPDFREQMLSLPLKPITAVLVTHEHYDHVGGIDDLRPFCVFGDMHLYMEDYVAERLRQRIPYCFLEKKYPGVPELVLHEVSPHETFQVGPVPVIPLRVMHARLPVLGYRMGPVVYITDMKTIPDSEFPFLEDVEVLVINGLRFQEHLSHQTITEACDFARRIGARRTFITHLSHQAGLHELLRQQMPPSVFIAYDGLQIELPDAF